MKIWIEVTLDEPDSGFSPDGYDEQVYSVVDAVYHTPGVVNVVQCRSTFPSPPAVHEHTRRPKAREAREAV